MSRSGSSGASLTTTCRRDKTADVSNLREAFLGCKAKDARHVFQHVGIGRRAENKFTAKTKPGRSDQTRKRLPTGVALSALDPRNYGLRRPGAFGELSLGQPSPCPRLP